jgi:hypothetical protein
MIVGIGTQKLIIPINSKIGCGTVENHVVHRVKYLIEMQLKRNAKKLAEAEMRQNLRDVAAAYRQGVLGSVVNMGR